LDRLDAGATVVTNFEAHFPLYGEFELEEYVTVTKSNFPVDSLYLPKYVPKKRDTVDPTDMPVMFNRDVNSPSGLEPSAMDSSNSCSSSY